MILVKIQISSFFSLMISAFSSKNRGLLPQVLILSYFFRYINCLGVSCRRTWKLTIHSWICQIWEEWMVGNAVPLRLKIGQSLSLKIKKKKRLSRCLYAHCALLFLLVPNKRHANTDYPSKVNSWFEALSSFSAYIIGNSQSGQECFHTEEPIVVGSQSVLKNSDLSRRPEAVGYHASFPSDSLLITVRPLGISNRIFHCIIVPWTRTPRVKLSYTDRSYWLAGCHDTSNPCANIFWKTHRFMVQIRDRMPIQTPHSFCHTA